MSVLRVQSLVTIGLVVMMVLVVGTDEPDVEPRAADPALGSGAEYPGFQSWEDRAPFMTLLDGPADTPGFGWYGANLGDVDGDGCDDFLSMDYTETEWSPSWTFTDATMLPGRSNGAFDEGQYEKLGIDILTYGCGDVNGDDRMDVISVNMPRERLWSYGFINISFEIRFGRSDGIPATEDQYFGVKPFSEGSTVYYRDPASSVFPIGDMNGDGFDDLMIFNLVDTEDRPVAEFQVFYGSAAGLEKKPRTHAVSLDGPKDYEMWNWTRGITHADVNADGRSDVIIAHGEPYYWGKWDRPDYLTIHLGSSDGFSPSPDQRIEQEGAENLITAIVPVSFNGDAYDDIAIVEVPAQEVAQGDGMNVSFHTGSVDGLSASRVYDRPFTIGGGWGRLHVGFSDLDGDGLDDILVLSNTIEDQEHDGFRLNIYDRRLVLWRNVNASFDEGPWWSSVVQRSTGDHVKIHRGDYDGDGRGDFLVTISGWQCLDGDDHIRSGDGSVILLLGRNSDNIAFPVFLSDGPVLYANHTTYDVIIEEVRLPGMKLEEIEIRFDPDGADALVRLRRSNDSSPGSRWMTPLVDPTDLINLKNLTDISDFRDNSSWVNLSIMFGWDWPHEDPCDVEIAYSYLITPQAGYGKTQIVTVPAVFSVENDLDLVGDMVVEGEHQGSLAPGDWVRGGEEVTVSGLRVVYQGSTDVYPPAGVCEVVLYDDEEHNSRVGNPSGDEVVLTLAVDDATDTDDSLNITLQALPGLAKGPAPLTFPIRVDADPPVLRDPMPDGDEWISAFPFMVGITADDTGTSGVDAPTLEFNYRRDPYDWDVWNGDAVRTTPSGPVVDGMVSLALHDGADHYIKWRVTDLVGNKCSMTDGIRLRVDTMNVTFSDHLPSPEVWHNYSRILTGITVTDVEGSGIDVTTLQYRVSHHNLSSYGPWTDYTGQHTDAREIVARVYVDFGEGPYNYVQWRAADIAGNGLTVSGHFGVWVDTTAPSFTGFTPTGIQNATELNVSVLLDDGPTGVGVRKDPSRPMGDEEFFYRVRSNDDPYGDWQLTHVIAIPVPWHGDAIPWIRYSTKSCLLSAILVGLVEGRENFVQFMASDILGNGPALSEEYRVFVDTQGPYFYNITPEPEEVLPHPEVAVSVSIGDAFSGLDIDNVQFRYGTEGEGSLGEWLRMPVESVDGEHVGMVTITLDRGKTNYIQFRAVDLVGNVNTSAPKMVWVNRLPVAVIARPSDRSVHTEGNPINLDPTGSYDADGDELTFTWSIVGEGRNEVFEGDRTVPLRPGIYNLTLVVTDVHGGEATASVQITVEEADEGLYGYLVGLLLVLVVVIVVALVAVYLRYREDEIAPE